MRQGRFFEQTQQDVHPNSIVDGTNDPDDPHADGDIVNGTNDPDDPHADGESNTNDDAVHVCDDNDELL